jgi:hypothetical protein
MGTREADKEDTVLRLRVPLDHLMGMVVVVVVAVGVVVVMRTVWGNVMVMRMVAVMVMVLTYTSSSVIPVNTATLARSGPSSAPP